MYKGKLYQAAKQDGELVIANADGIVIHAAMMLEIAALKQAAENVLATSDRFDLMANHNGSISHECFADYETAFAAMLYKLNGEFWRYYKQMAEPYWADVYGRNQSLWQYQNPRVRS